MSQTGLCSVFAVFPGAVEGLHSCFEGFWNGRHLLGASSRDLSDEDVANCAIRGCGSTLHFFGESENNVIEFDAVVVKVLHCFKERACAKSEETGAELFVEEGLVERGGCEVH